MKILLLFLSVLSVLSLRAQSHTDTIKVWGSCEMCKTKIQSAAMTTGASAADWNEKTKMLVVSYDLTATSKTDIEKSVARAGYDTEDVKATDEAYNNLEKCCQYERPANGNEESSTMDNHGGKKFCAAPSAASSKKKHCDRDCGKNKTASE